MIILSVKLKQLHEKKYFYAEEHRDTSTNTYMMKKIYPKAWLELHPYKTTSSTDLYYVDIANKIHSSLFYSPIFDAFEDDEERCYTSLCLAAWFEDVISQTRIWETFTAECKKRYGSYLPFYPIEDDYYPDEINLEDIRFLLWHHVQYLHKDHSIINPENPGIEIAAVNIYELLSQEYEVAPENEKMQEYLLMPNVEQGDFYPYRKLLEWFHYHCYFNIENDDEYADGLQNLLDNKEEFAESMDLIAYAAYMELMFSGCKNLLSFTSPEWLAKIRKDGTQHALLASVNRRPHSCYLYEREDEDYLYVSDLCMNNEEITITKKSLNLAAIKDRQEGESVLLCTPIRYGDTWWQCGMLMMEKYDTRMQEFIKERSAELNKTNEKEAFESFMQASNGNPFVFCQSKEEITAFLSQRMGYKMGEGVQMPNIGNKGQGLLLTATPRTGIHIQAELLECIQSPDNPFYNEETAQKEAYMFILNPSMIPYELSCVLQDRGMLPDAILKSVKGDAYGRKFLQENSQFFTDYFHYKCREKDFNERAFNRFSSSDRTNLSSRS